ncbi:LysR family transcriptional regulator [Phenylobacterium sp.]|uniref:LysR family transcriptional regulator n=1 Tax=Phenylobacterium sp. TaxID=1871053 RepID=UPI0025D1D10D|nr:LysR family transcriptional regulator [Phenylobacterium sp.]MBX3481939.1 LysR family transcriptional regulator [Phenylobacterium sp.]
MSDIDLNKLRRLDGGLLLVLQGLLQMGRASLVAERLGLSQPAVSHALARLRDLFDDPLFVRRPHGLEPTRRALELRPRVEALIRMAGDVLSDGSGFDPATSDRIFRIAVPEFVAALIGAGLINRLKDVAPGVSFALDHLSEEDILRPLRLGDGEFAIGRFGAARAGYTVEPFLEDYWCAVARADHPDLAGGALTLERWRNIGHVFAWSPSETGQKPTMEPVPDMVMRAAVPGWLTALLMVASTDAIATVPRRLADRHASKLGLQVLDLPFLPERFAVSVMRRAGVVDAGADWFLGEVRAAAGV